MGTRNKSVIYFKLRIDLTPALGATCSRLIAEMAASITITDSIAMSMRRLVPQIEAKSRYILNKSLISQDNLPDFANYSNLIHLKHKLEYVEENLRILRQKSIDMPIDMLNSDINVMENYKKMLNFQRACLKSIKYRLVPRLSEANEAAVKQYGLNSKVSYQVEEVDILQYIKSRPELVQHTGWQRIVDLIERLAFGLTDICSIMNELFEIYNLRDIRAVYYIQFYTDADAQINFISQVERDMKAMCQAGYDYRRDDSIIIPQKEKEWPGNLFAYWEILAINCGRDLAKYGLFDLVRITEKLCEDYLYQSGRHAEEVQDSILPGLSKADPTIDPYWLPFVLYRLRVLGIKELVELYEKVALSIINDLSPNPTLRGCYLLRMLNNLVNLGFILVDRVIDRKSLSIDTSSLMITQNNATVQNTILRQPTGEERARLTVSLLGSIRDVCKRIQSALDNHRAEVMHLKMYPITQRRQEKLETDIRSLNVEKSLATYNSKIF